MLEPKSDCQYRLNCNDTDVACLAVMESHSYRNQTNAWEIVETIRQHVGSRPPCQQKVPHRLIPGYVQIQRIVAKP